MHGPIEILAMMLSNFGGTKFHAANSATLNSVFFLEMDVFGVDSEAFLDFGCSKISCDFQGQGFDIAVGTQSSNHWCSHLFLLRFVLLANPQGKQQTVHREGHPLLKVYGE